MQDPRKMSFKEATKLKPKKKKSQRAMMVSPMQGNNYLNTRGVVVPDLPPPLMPSKTIKKASRKVPKNGLAPLPHHPQQERLVVASGFQEGPTYGNEFEGLIRKYMMLEEETYSLGKELEEVVEEIKNLEDEKLELLDQLVVLEGLVDPLELQNR